MPKYIEITEDEAWAIDHTIRHTYADAANNVGKDLLLKVMTLVLEFEERRGKPFAPQVLPLALTEDECWAVDHQIRCDLTVNGKPIGRGLLLKVFRALTEFANDRDSESGVQQLGSLADLLRAPAEEEPSSSQDAPDGEGSPRGESRSTGAHGPDGATDTGPSNRAGGNSSGPSGRPNNPDDGPAPTVPRDK